MSSQLYDKLEDGEDDEDDEDDAYDIVHLQQGVRLLHRVCSRDGDPQGAVRRGGRRGADEDDDKLGYDLCTYNKIDLFKTGVFSTMSYTFSMRVLLNALEWEGIQHSSINIRKVVSFFHNFTGVHSSYKNPYKETLKEDGSVDSLKKLYETFSLKYLDELNRIGERLRKSKDTPPYLNLNPFKLGIVYKYQFAGGIRCNDRTYLIVNLQRRFRKWHKTKYI